LTVWSNVDGDLQAVSHGETGSRVDPHSADREIPADENPGGFVTQSDDATGYGVSVLDATFAGRFIGGIVKIRRLRITVFGNDREGLIVFGSDREGLSVVGSDREGLSVVGNARYGAER
jgi:hypothetical protein